MINVSIERLYLNDRVSISDIHISCRQAMFVSSPIQVMAIIKETGHKNINLPFSIKSSDKTIGFFTLNFYSPLTAQADPLYFGGENDCRLESFMIDERYQGKGFGNAAISEITQLLSKDYPHIKGLKLSVNFLNEMAKLFYLKCGFKDTGKVYEGGPAGPQHIYRLDLSKS
ncbi:MAG: GNAT family N-acetyltransferase [Deltaproteobacteria bacterium]|nr:GNAT family N-acetyltransferase [Deltaproteobacteria bacterium]